MSRFVVKVIHAETDRVKRYVIDGEDCVPSGAQSFGPSRTLAGMRARERFAEDCGEAYSSDLHKVLSIEAIHDQPAPEEVVRARRLANLTQQQAADLVGLTLKAWQHYEYGAREMAAPTWKLFLYLTDLKDSFS